MDFGCSNSAVWDADSSCIGAWRGANSPRPAFAFVSRVCIITYCPKDCKQNPTTLAMRSGFLPGSVRYNTGKGLYRIKTRTAPFGRKLPGSQIEKGQNRRVFSRNRDQMCYHWPVGPLAGLCPAFFGSEACPRKPARILAAKRPLGILGQFAD